MSKDELLFDFNDARKTWSTDKKSKRKKTNKGRSVSSFIFVREECDGWRLFTVCLGCEQPAGHRLLKKKPWPIEKFLFDTKQEAEENAEALAAYLGIKINE
tara:strand:- start:60 stop:362 length:303 start_codon:yes stop_codon:yes gene_type:complete